MNKTHTVVWNDSKGCWTVASECARRRGKSGVTSVRLLAISLAAAGLTVLTPSVQAGPTGGQVTHGQAVISQNTSGTSTFVQQSSSKAVIDWQTFNINSNERVTFNQPDKNSMTLNYVSGVDRKSSLISGVLSANGHVFLVNPNGVVFNYGSRVNVGGLVASTRNTDPAAFMANTSGEFSFDSGPTDRRGQVANLGNIIATSGDIALLGRTAWNFGAIQATNGGVALGAGESFTVNLGNGPLNLRITKAADGAGVDNRGPLRAGNGHVELQARSSTALPFDVVVNNEGVIEAKSLASHAGRIILDGGERGTVRVSGALNVITQASGSQTGSSAIDLAGERLSVSASTAFNTRSSNGRVGSLKFETRGDNVLIAQSNHATVQASALAGYLARNNVEIKSAAGDVQVDAPVYWNSGTTLALTAQSAKDTGKVIVNRALTANGNAAGLTLAAGERIDINDRITLSGANSALSLATSGANANYHLRGAPGQGAAITLSGENARFVANNVDYGVIRNQSQLQAIGDNPSGNYVLGANLTGSGVIKPISSGPDSAFTGTFDGLGNTLSNISVSARQGGNVGLFATSQGTIRNLRLDGITVNSSQGANLGEISIGALAGSNTGQIRNVHVTGNVTGDAMRGNITGGLVGTNAGGRLDDTSFSGQVQSGAATTSLGGLVGANLGGTVKDSLVYATVSGGNAMNIGGAIGTQQGGRTDNVISNGRVIGGAQSAIGGLIGKNTGSGDVLDAIVFVGSSSGSVHGGDGSEIGGLVGVNVGAHIFSSDSDSAVYARNGASTGGLVGNNSGIIAASYAYGNVSDSGIAEHLGGLVGSNTGIISRGRALGSSVSAANNAGSAVVGGLVGWNAGKIVDSHSGVKSVTAGDNTLIGGLVGVNVGQIQRSSAYSGVQGGKSSSVGGIAGKNQGSIHDAYTMLGSVRGHDDSKLGGVAGENLGTIANADARSDVYGFWRGGNGAQVVARNARIGGLAGVNHGSIVDSTTNLDLYVSNNAGQVYGRLAGVNNGVLTNNVAQGRAPGQPLVGIDHTPEEGVEPF